MVYGNSSDRTAAKRTVSVKRRRGISSRREALVLALWALVGGCFIFALIRTDAGELSYQSITLLIIGLVLVLVVFRISRARARTVRPRHFTVTEALASLWLAIGGSIAASVLDRDGASLSTALVATVIVSAPLFGCALWLAVRGR